MSGLAIDVGLIFTSYLIDSFYKNSILINFSILHLIKSMALKGDELIKLKIFFINNTAQIYIC